MNISVPELSKRFLKALDSNYNVSDFSMSCESLSESSLLTRKCAENDTMPLLRIMK